MIFWRNIFLDNLTSIVLYLIVYKSHYATVFCFSKWACVNLLSLIIVWTFLSHLWKSGPCTYIIIPQIAKIFEILQFLLLKIFQHILHSISMFGCTGIYNVKSAIIQTYFFMLLLNLELVSLHGYFTGISSLKMFYSWTMGTFLDRFWFVMLTFESHRYSSYLIFFSIYSLRERGEIEILKQRYCMDLIYFEMH